MPFARFRLRNNVAVTMFRNNGFADSWQGGWADYTPPVPRAIPQSQIAEVCKLVQAGKRQRDIALLLGKSTTHVNRCIALARQALTEQTHEVAWLSARQRTHVEVANMWLRTPRATGE